MYAQNIHALSSTALQYSCVIYVNFKTNKIGVLVTGHAVMAMRARAPLLYWSGAAIFDRAGSACRQYCSSSPALGVIC